MRVERLGSDAVRRFGGPAGAAAHLRSLVPAGDSVSSAVSEIVEAVRTRGDAALLELTRRLDTAGAEPRPLVVGAQEMDAALKSMPLDVVAGLQVTIANVAVVAQAGVGEDTNVTLPQGQRVTLREIPVAAAGVYAPGGGRRIRAPWQWAL